MFVPGWHIDAICQHLEAVTRGEIRNLVINIPPRHAKSLLVSVFWPTWEWIHSPHLRYIYSSYGQDLATRDALKSRRLIQSVWYQDRFWQSFQLTGDQNQKTFYENDRTGYRLATGVGGLATGHGGQRLVLDDPHKLADAHSDTALLNAVTFWNETMSTRGNDPETVAKVVIMQRVHEADVTGDIIEKMEAGGEQYEMLVLPAEYEPRRAHMFKGKIEDKDPRTEEGELLWPQRFSRSTLESLKVTLHEQAPGQLQQRPSPAGGTIFKREWWEDANRWDPTDYRNINKITDTWVAWDTANKKEDRNAFTAGVVGSLLPDYRLLIRYAVIKRVTFDELEEFVTNEVRPFTYDYKLRAVVIEDAASGTQLFQVLQARGEDWLRSKITAEPANRLGKEANWEAAADWCRQGCVLLPEPSDEVPWLRTLEDPLFKVPAAKFVDVVDAFSILVNHVEEYTRAFSTRVNYLRHRVVRGVHRGVA